MGRIRGFDKLVNQLKGRRKQHADRFEIGITRAGLFLMAESMKLVPVDTGILRASGQGFPQIEGKGFKAVAICGYTAWYAIYVHELEPIPRHGQEFNEWHAEDIAAGREKERGPDQQAKFLTRPLKTHRRTLFRIIKEALEG